MIKRYPDTNGWALACAALLVAAPIAGSGATAFLVLVTLFASFSILLHGPGGIPKPALVLAGIFAFYILYFLTVGTVRGTFSEAAKAMGRNIPILLCILLILALPSRVRGLSPRLISDIATGVVWCVALAALAQHAVTECTKADLLPSNTLILGATLLAPVFLSALDWHGQENRRRILTIATVILGQFTVMYLADSRSAALVGALLLLALLWFLRIGILRAIGLGVFVVCTIYALGSVKTTLCQGKSEILERYGHVLQLADGAEQAAEADQSISHRFDLYTAGWKAFQQRPIFGHGPQNRFRAARPYLTDQTATNYTHLHGTIATHAVAGGVVGVLAMIAMGLSPLGIAAWGGIAQREHWYFALIAAGSTQTALTNLLYNHDILSTHFGFLPVATLIFLRTWSQPPNP